VALAVGQSEGITEFEFQPGTTRKAMLRIWIRIRRIHMFLGLLDPDPDPLVRGMDPDPDLVPDPGLSIIKQK
jgi:hypothetical protein